MISGAVVSSLELSVLIVEVVPSAFTNPVLGRSAAALLCCCQGDEDVVGNLMGNGHSGGHTDDGIVLFSSTGMVKMLLPPLTFAMYLFPFAFTYP